MSYVGASIGSIRIESRLGLGGMGEVYLGAEARPGVERLAKMGVRSADLGDLCREKRVGSFERFFSESPEL